MNYHHRPWWRRHDVCCVRRRGIRGYPRCTSRDFCAACCARPANRGLQGGAECGGVAVRCANTHGPVLFGLLHDRRTRSVRLTLTGTSPPRRPPHRRATVLEQPHTLDTGSSAERKDMVPACAPGVVAAAVKQQAASDVGPEDVASGFDTEVEGRCHGQRTRAQRCLLYNGASART